MRPMQHELRVLAGPQQGATLLLKAGASVDVGSFGGADCQVVLRDPQVTEQRVRLHVGQTEVRIEVLAGSIDVAGQRLVAPCTTNWPFFVTLQMGQTVLAVGRPDADESCWARALSGTPASPWPSMPTATSPQASADAPGGLGGADEMLSPPRRRPEAWLAAGGALVTVLASGLLAFVSVIAPAQGEPLEPAPQRAARVLRAPEFQRLRIETDADQRLHIRGDLLSLADRTRLDLELHSAAVEATVHVRVGEQIAASVREVYRMNGVVAQTLAPVAIAGVGSVKVTTHEGDLAKLQHAEAAARRDVRGLTLLEADNTPPVASAAPTPVVDDPGKRVASIVPGATPYVVTADGSRYFSGALLPSGHRLDSISEQQVMLEKDGRVSPLNF